jgi:hypothetical protein
MADSQTSTTNDKDAPKAAAKGAKDAGAEQVQETMDAEQEQGFRGVKTDPTPDEHYTVAGVTAGKPTPETDPDAHHEAAMASRMEGRFPGLEPRFKGPPTKKD